MLDPISGGREVSRETLDKLRAFENLVRQWTRSINLVSRTDLNEIWRRHILDSAQLVDMTRAPERWVDLGSGGGFPGIVVAIFLQVKGTGRVILVESDTRKCAFLMTAARKLDLDVDILQQRVEDLQPANATTLSARALAPLTQLLPHADIHLRPDGTALFPKGRNWKNELKAAKDKWSFECDVIQSTTDKAAAILRLQNIKRL